MSISGYQSDTVLQSYSFHADFHFCVYGERTRRYFGYQITPIGSLSLYLYIKSCKNVSIFFKLSSTVGCP